jgi:predicted permease
MAPMLTWLRRLPARVRALRSFRQLDDDFDDELATHLAMATDDYQRRGLSLEDARRLARLRLGNPAVLGDRHREIRGLPAVEGLARDLRYALRTLRRDSALTLFAVLIAGLGIGATTTVFGVVHALLIRPLPFNEPDRLVWIANGDSDNLSERTVQVVNLLTLRERSRSLVDVGGFSPFYGIGDVHLTGAAGPQRITAVRVTQDFFRVLGIRPHLGRFFTADECQWNAPLAVVLSHTFWQRRFAADPAVVGRTVTLNLASATIVGVLPPEFDFASTLTTGHPADVFTPFPLSAETNRQGNTLALIGRLRPGALLAEAQAEADVVGVPIDVGSGPIIMGRPRNAFRPRLTPLQEHVSGRYRSALLVVTASVGLVMLLVCANLSNLLLSRGAGRHRDMAVRTALGASRAQLIRQMLVESLVLAFSGGALGVALAWAATRVVAQLVETGVPLLPGVRMDPVTVGAAVIAAWITGVAVGLLPAFKVSAAAPHRLMQSARGGIGGHRDPVRRGIVIVEVAIACILLVGSGLLVRSLTSVLAVDPGFAAEQIFTVRVDPGRSVERDRVPAYFESIVRHVSAVHGVDAVGLTDALPLGTNLGWRRWTVSPKEQAEDRERRRDALIRIVDEGYLETMSIPLQAGRAFSAGDAEQSEQVAIVNETLARRLWPDGDAVGRVLVASRVERRVVGVVGGVRYFGLDREADAELYLPLRQSRGDHTVVDLVLRSAVAPDRLVQGVRLALAGAAPDLPTNEIRTMQELVDRSLFGRRAATQLLAGFAVFGLMLAALGVYAVVSHAVSQRRQEFALRMALGATPADIRARVLAQTAWLTLIGFAVGVPAAWLAAGMARAMLFDVAPTDPVTMLGVIMLLGGVVFLATDIPARRAIRMDPAVALRGD